MKRSTVLGLLAALLVGCVSLPAFAGDRAGVVGVERPGGPAAGNEPPLGRFLVCLRILDLTPEQKADIQAILEASRPVISADVAAIQAPAEKLRADLESGADRCVIGQDTLDVRAAEQKLAADVDGVKGQIVATLTDDQKARLRGCLDAPARPGADATARDGSR